MTTVYADALELAIGFSEPEAAAPGWTVTAGTLELFADLSTGDARVYAEALGLAVELPPGAITAPHTITIGAQLLDLAGELPAPTANTGEPLVELGAELPAATVTASIGAAALRWRIGATELTQLGALGTLPGVQIVRPAGLNGPGTGRLDAVTDGTALRWTAPGGTTPGPAVNVSAGGTRRLADGDNADRYLEVLVTAGELPPGPAAAVIRLSDLEGSGIDGGNVTAAEASAGKTSTTTITLANALATTLSTVAVWLDPATGVTALSWDNVNFYSPTSEAAALATMGSVNIAGSSTQALYVRRTIPAAAAANPRELVIVNAGHADGAGGRHYTQARGFYRIANAAEYRIYRKLGSEPVPGVDIVWATSPTLPYSPAGTFADGEWYVAVTYFNGYIESQALTVHRIDVSGGAADELPPNAPEFWATQTAGGVVRVQAIYWPLPDEAADRVADEWALWYTNDGSPPGTGSPQYTEPMSFTRGYAYFEYYLSPYGVGTTVKTLVRARRALGTKQSINATAATIVLPAALADAPDGAHAWIGA